MLRGFWRGRALGVLRRTTLGGAISERGPLVVLHVTWALVPVEGRERVEVGGRVGRGVLCDGSYHAARIRVAMSSTRACGIVQFGRTR